MKKLSIKLKITLWFGMFMLILAAVVFGFIALLSKSETHRQIENALVAGVNENIKEVRYSDGKLKIGDGFEAYRDGVYCLVYDRDDELCGGDAPNMELANEPLKDGVTRHVTLDDERYLIYDLKESDKHRTIWVRGIARDSGTEISAGSLYFAALVSIPFLILLAAVGGYLLAKKSLQPIRTISQTAEDIGRSGDLTKRIDIDANGDELHELAGSFNRMFDTLERSFEAEKQFTSDASHELRTPITTILAQCEYAFENASGEDELYEVIGDIQKQGYRMSRLVESLLSFTRLEQRTGELALEDTDLSACVNAVCEEQKMLFQKEVELTEEIQPGIRMKADPTLMTRLVENLIRNAYRYGKENGHIHVTLAETDGKIILSVADDGIGIAPEELPKIWNRFYRADKSRSYSEGSGLGLGLAMVKQIAELHHGEISVESEPGRGSCFTVHF